jgi:hypothetical protein
MTTDDYRRALETAVREYEDLGQRRQAIDSRLAEIAQTIGTLSRLCGLVPAVPMGLTDACRLVTRGGVPMTPADVRARLLAIGFDLSKYANDLAAIHTILKRLNGSGELRFLPRASGKPAQRGGARAGHRRVHARFRLRTRSDANPPRAAALAASGREGEAHEDTEDRAEVTDLHRRRRFHARSSRWSRRRSPRSAEALVGNPLQPQAPPRPRPSTGSV